MPNYISTKLGKIKYCFKLQKKEKNSNDKGLKSYKIESPHAFSFYLPLKGLPFLQTQVTEFDSLKNVFSSFMSLSCCGHHDKVPLRFLTIGSIIDSSVHAPWSYTSHRPNMAGRQMTLARLLPEHLSNQVSFLSSSLHEELDLHCCLITLLAFTPPFFQRVIWYLSLGEPVLTTCYILSWHQAPLSYL